MAYFLHELKWNFDSLFISWIVVIFIFNWFIFFMKWNEVLIHYFSWIATKFTFKWLIFFMNWNEILIHYFFHELKWCVHSIYLFENSYSHKIHIWMYSFFQFTNLFLSEIFFFSFQRDLSDKWLLIHHWHHLLCLLLFLFVKLLSNMIFLKVYQYLLEAFMRNYLYALKSFCIIFNCF